jgi:hypothetical protein
VRTNKLTNSKIHIDGINDGNIGLIVSNNIDDSSSNSIYSTRDGKNSSNSSTSSSSDGSIVGINKLRRNKLQKYQSTLQHNNISLKSKKYHHPLVFHNNSAINNNTFDNNDDNNNNDNYTSTTTIIKNNSSRSITEYKYHPNFNNVNSSTNYDYSYDLLSSFMNEDEDVSLNFMIMR